MCLLLGCDWLAKRSKQGYHMPHGTDYPLGFSAQTVLFMPYNKSVMFKIAGYKPCMFMDFDSAEVHIKHTITWPMTSHRY